jgi:outer membrane protein OmpA-like peptidoglycan-associated protein
MRPLPSLTLALVFCATPGSAAKPENEFVLKDSDHSNSKKVSKIQCTDTEAALKLFVIERETSAPIPGIIIAVTGEDGKKFYTDETDADGYAELLVPIGQRYELAYLGLGRRDVAAKVTVDKEPRQNIRLTVRYKRFDKKVAGATAPEPRFVLEGVNFDSGRSQILPESLPRLDSVAEYMTRKESVQIEISGHTDSAGNAKSNKELSLRRAQACRGYLMSKGIDGSRISAVGFGDEKPVASNATEEGRRKNRRIEATER